MKDINDLETIAIEDIFEGIDAADAQMDRYRRAYKYLLDQVICYQGNIGDTRDKMWQWMDDDVSNARAIAGEK